jgi:hypothetical protein
VSILAYERWQSGVDDVVLALRGNEGLVALLPLVAQVTRLQGLLLPHGDLSEGSLHG